MRHTSGLSRRTASTPWATAAGLSEDLDLVGFEHHSKSDADHFLVVDDHHGGHGVTSMGSRALRWNPPPDIGSATRVPPKTATRSRMPTRP